MGSVAPSPDSDRGLQSTIRHGILHGVRDSTEEFDEEVPGLTERTDSGDTVEGLIARLQHDGAQERWEAAEALGHLLVPPAVDALARALCDPHPFVRLQAGQALGRIASRLRRRSTGVPLLRVFRPEIQISSLVETLAPLAGDPRGYVRASAADALGELRVASGVPVLLLLLDDDDDEVRASAAVALGKLRAEKAVGGLVTLLGHDSVAVRRAAIEGLGAIGGLDASQALMEELKSRNPMVRAGAAAALAHCQEAGVTKALIGALDDELPEIRVLIRLRPMSQSIIQNLALPVCSQIQNGLCMVVP